MLFHHILNSKYIVGLVTLPPPTSVLPEKKKLLLVMMNNLRGKQASANKAQNADKTKN